MRSAKSAITVYIPPICTSEIEYIIAVILDEFLGLDFIISSQTSDNNSIIITANDKKIELPNTFFKVASKSWLQPESLPKTPLKQWNTSEFGIINYRLDGNLPVLYGIPKCKIENDYIYLGLDIFGSAFFMLSRYEEVVNKERDSHGRFPATASLAYQEGFLHRPIINEYIDILWACIKNLWPTIERKKRDFRFLLTHDVDSPYDTDLYHLKKLLRRVGADILKRKSISEAVGTIRNSIIVKQEGYKKDPYNTFEYIMEQSERKNIKSAFYFIADHSAGAIDGDYHINDDRIRTLLRNIYNRDHEIGLHTSYNTYQNENQTKKEFNLLKNVCEQEGIIQKCWGGRQHFLRWEAPTTFRNWDVANLDYDSTLTYADMPGFRCGICYEYTTYDVVQRMSLRLKERPLIIMESSIITDNYLGLGLSVAAFEQFKILKDTCRKYSGDFTLLWHNSMLATRQQKEFYEAVLSA